MVLRRMEMASDATEGVRSAHAALVAGDQGHQQSLGAKVRGNYGSVDGSAYSHGFNGQHAGNRTRALCHLISAFLQV